MTLEGVRDLKHPIKKKKKKKLLIGWYLISRWLQRLALACKSKNIVAPYFASCREHRLSQEITRLRCFTRSGWRTRITHRRTSRRSSLWIQSREYGLGKLAHAVRLAVRPRFSRCWKATRAWPNFCPPLATSTLRDIAPGIYKPTGCEIYASMPTDSRETESSSMRRDATT